LALCESILNDITKITKAACNKCLFMPLGVGQHRDHQIIFQVGTELLSLENRVFDLLYYEDTPYTFIPNLLKYRMKMIGIKFSEMENAKEIIQRKPAIQEIKEVYRSIVCLPLLEVNKIFKKIIVFLFTTLFVISVLYLPRPRHINLKNRSLLPELYKINSRINEKLEAIIDYRSQLIPLFGDTDKNVIKNFFEKYSVLIEGTKGQFLERYWKIIM